MLMPWRLSATKHRAFGSSHRASRALARVRIAILFYVAAICVLACGSQARAQHSAAPPTASKPAAIANQHVSPPGLYDPIADPRAVVTLGNARFTVLTPQLLRMEWSADGKFEDHASFVFLNRNLPVPRFAHEISSASDRQTLTIETDALKLTYSPAASGDGKFSADNLEI